MELIQALEQLSLEVKNQQLSNELSKFNQSNDSHSLANFTINSQQQLNFNSIKDATLTHPSSLKPHINQQLEQFDDSIKTLFAQITDLDCIEQNQHLNLIKGVSSFAYRQQQQRINNNRCNFASTRSHGSIETSQEEDSDSSTSQRSFIASTSNNDNIIRQSTNNNNNLINPLVKDLLKKDLSAITDTVRKISQILAIGNRIELLYTNLEDGQDDNHIDLNSARSLCDSYISLCSSEPHLRDLPTIIRFSEYCYKLIDEINKLTLTMHTSSNLYSNLNDDNRAKAIVKIEEEDDNDGFFEVDDKSMCDNWTENKLYKY